MFRQTHPFFGLADNGFIVYFIFRARLLISHGWHINVGGKEDRHGGPSHLIHVRHGETPHMTWVAARRRRRQAWKCDGRCIAWLKVVPIELHIIHVHRVRFNPKGLYGSRIYSSDASVVEDNLFEDLTSRIGS
ncbi:uncharacterized protein [Panulirus ornatus]|uniref:uncharacterized protein isoform X1 n=1 Tax=Panulirus ornatus TaxID=150431 RepID=UPI003A8A1EAD